MNETSKGIYDHIKCPCCGIALEEHTDECFRHKHLFQKIWDRKCELFMKEEERIRNGHTSGPSSVAIAMARILKPQ